MPRASRLPVVLLLFFALTLLLAVPAFADDGPIAQPVQQADAAQSDEIKPVSPQEFAQKTTTMMDSLYKAASPIADTAAKVMLLLCGVCAFFVLISGMKLLHRVIGAVLSIGFGLILYYGAPYIVGLFKGLAMYALH